MNKLQAITESQTRLALGLSPEEFETARHPSPKHLHDPFEYKDMFELVMRLRQIWKEQQTDPSHLLIIDGDYDTDGICGAVILAASLSVFGFRFQVYIPSMAEGYGMSREIVDRMKQYFEQDGKKIQAILTADQGIQAFSAIRYAKESGIHVLVTDHHPGSRKLPEADAVVNPNRPGDQYPFKGNSGACVAWKTMLAYADRFEKEKKPLIERLILFAGISNVADVMPLLDENRYTVQAAMTEIRNMRKKKSYAEIADTPYSLYNTAFYGLYDLITLLQEEKDQKRNKEGKRPVPLPENEELIGWYISPMLNAPRRVHDTCMEGLAAFLLEDPRERQEMIRRLIQCNEEKSQLRDKVIDNLSKEEKQLPLLCVNTRKGIAGLIAGQLSEKSGGLPAIILSYEEPELPKIRLTEQDLPKETRLSGSARSSALCPLNILFTKVQEKAPHLISWGGHAGGAGCSVMAKDLPRFTTLLQEMIPQVTEEILAQPVTQLLPANEIQLYLSAPNTLIALFPRISEENQERTMMETIQTETFASDVKDIIAFQESLRPFGKDFPAQTRFSLTFSKSACKAFDPDFWKTFKFRMFGVEVITFDTEWAKTVKEGAEHALFHAHVKLQINTFRGKETPQMILTPKEVTEGDRIRDSHEADV